MALELTIEIDSDAFKKSLEEAAADFDNALETAKNMVASMIEDQTKADILSAGNFGAAYADNLSVTVQGDEIITTLDAPGADIFQDGGTIHGNPLLWLPITGTDAVGTQAKDYGQKLFSVNRKAGGPPLLFSMSDKKPKYFGIPSVFIPKKFHLEEIQLSVMENFASVFKEAMNNG